MQVNPMASECHQFAQEKLPVNTGLDRDRTVCLPFESVVGTLEDSFVFSFFGNAA